MALPGLTHRGVQLAALPQGIKSTELHSFWPTISNASPQLVVVRPEDVSSSHKWDLLCDAEGSLNVTSSFWRVFNGCTHVASLPDLARSSAASPTACLTE